MKRILLDHKALLLSLLTILTSTYSFSEENTSERAIEEVVITVERRETTLQDYGGTAVSFSGDELKKQGLQDITDLSESVVGLEIGNSRGNVEVWIRGVGSSNNTELGDPAAATHVDGIYIPRPRGIGGAFFDLERVEVNIGPQGTLRGRNAMDGSVNAIPWRPGFGMTDVAMEIERGNYDQEIYRLTLNAPVGDDFAVRYSMQTQNHDPYYNDVSPLNIKGPESADNMAARLQFAWQPTDRLYMLLASDVLLEEGTGYTGTNYANPLGNGVDADDIDDPRDVYLRGSQAILDSKHWGIKLQVDYEFDQGKLEFNYGRRDLLYDYQAPTPLSPDYPGVVENLGGDNIGEALDNFSSFYDITDSVSDIYELRYYTSPENTVFFTTGVFYFVEKQTTFLGATGDGDTFFQGFEFNQPNTDTESISIYGDATWNFNDKTRFTAGLRFTDDHKERVGVNAQYRFSVGGLNTTSLSSTSGMGLRFGTEGFEFAVQDRSIFNPDTNGDGEVTETEYYEFFLDGIKTFGARDNIDDAVLNALNGNPTATPCVDTRLDDELICDGPNFTFFAPTSNRASIAPQRGSIDESYLDWRLRAEYDIDEDHFLYGLIATGHKAGGFNDTFAVLYNNGVRTFDETLANEVRYQNGAGDVKPTYDAERVTMYEIGSKNQFDFSYITAQLNASFFLQDFSNQVFCNVLSVQQIFQGINVEQTGSQTVSLGVNYCQNTTKSEYYGSQVDGTLFFTNGMTFKLSGLWLESEIKRSQLIQDSRFQADVDKNSSKGVDIQGNTPPRTPEYSLNMSLSQQIDLPFGLFDYILSASWRDEQFLTIFNGIDYQQPDNPRKRLDDTVPAYWTFDFGSGLDILDTNFRFEAFVNNMTNEVRPTALLLTQFDNTRFFTRPRTFGLRMKWKM